MLSNELGLNGFFNEIKNLQDLSAQFANRNHLSELDSIKK